MRVGLRQFSAETVGWLLAGELTRSALARQLCEREDWRDRPRTRSSPARWRSWAGCRIAATAPRSTRCWRARYSGRPQDGLAAVVGAHGSAQVGTPADPGQGEQALDGRAGAGNGIGPGLPVHVGDHGLTGTFDTASGPYPLRDQANSLNAEPVLAAIGPTIDRAPISLEEDAHLALVADEEGPGIDAVVGVVELASRVFAAVESAANVKARRRAGEPLELGQGSMDCSAQCADHADAALHVPSRAARRADRRWG